MAPLADDCPSSALRPEWQWSLPVPNSRENPGAACAWLWIPPTCERVRGAVVAQHNMEEISILENPKFRAALAELNFAEIWVAPPFDHLFRFNEGAGETFNSMMDGLAEESGYAELKFVPVVPMGHSAAASWPYYFAAWNPGRTLAALSVSGQWPYFRDKAFAPDIWGDRNIDFVPGLESMGEYESANDWSREGLRERQQHPNMPLSMLANPGQGHFASTDAKVEYLALYLKKAVQYRVPTNWDAAAAPELIPIDPTKTGWLADKWRINQPPAAPAAPVGAYTGDPQQAFWFFDQELAEATVKYEAAYRGLKPQLVGYVQDGSMVAQKNSHLQVDLKFEPETDGVTFHLSGAFYDVVPGGSPRLPGWTGLPVGSPLEHPANSNKISIDRFICGRFEKIGPGTFRVCLQKETLLVANSAHLRIGVCRDAPRRCGIQTGRAASAHVYSGAQHGRRGSTHYVSRNSRPQSQERNPFHFEPHPIQAARFRSISAKARRKLTATNCVLRKFRRRAKFPVKVTVVAWQYGSAVEPKLKTAGPVERSFLIGRDR